MLFHSSCHWKNIEVENNVFQENGLCPSTVYNFFAIFYSVRNYRLVHFHQKPLQLLQHHIFWWLLAWRINSSSPPFKLMEFTTHFPWFWQTSFKISHLEESIIIGILEISGSEAIKFKEFNHAIFFRLKVHHQNKCLKICAPPSTWWRAISKASENFSSLINLRNF